MNIDINGAVFKLRVQLKYKLSLLKLNFKRALVMSIFNEGLAIYFDLLTVSIKRNSVKTIIRMYIFSDLFEWKLQSQQLLFCHFKNYGP